MTKTVLNNSAVKVQKSGKGHIPLIKDMLLKAGLPVNGVEEHFENFLSLTIHGKLIGAAGLEIYEDKGLLRSLVLKESYRGKGFGQRLCSAVIEKARRDHISDLYLLTETAAPFFVSQGFKKIGRDAAHEKVKESEEFRTLCPASAICMQLNLQQASDEM